MPVKDIHHKAATNSSIPRLRTAETNTPRLRFQRRSCPAADARQIINAFTRLGQIMEQVSNSALRRSLPMEEAMSRPMSGSILSQAVESRRKLGRKALVVGTANLLVSASKNAEKNLVVEEALGVEQVLVGERIWWNVLKSVGKDLELVALVVESVLVLVLVSALAGKNLEVVGALEVAERI